jgi:hypothetical protein
MKVVVASILVAGVLALAFSLPALAGESEGVTITMTGTEGISISLDKTQWPLGEVAPDTEYMTVPPIEWCTLTVTGNTEVNTSIMGEDAQWVDNPSAYEWILSEDGFSGEDVYGLWFRISGDTSRGPYGDGYVPITKTEGQFWPYGGGSSLNPGDSKQFGLRLITPSSFIGGREMETQITISAVAP